MNYNVNFSSHGKTVSMEEGKTLLNAAAVAGIPLESNCGGTGKCGKCKVRVAEGYTPQEPAAGKRFFSEEETANGWVLGCKYEIHQDLTVEVPVQFDAGDRKLQMNSLLDQININSPIKKVYVELEKPTIKDQCPDYERILRALNLDVASQKPSRGLIKIIPKTIRDAQFKVTAVLHGNDLMWVEEGDTTSKRYGVVFDIGTTTVVALLIDLNDGKIKGAAAETNPQNVFGADVISRINYAMTNGEEGLAHLHDKVVTCMNDLALRAAAEAKVDHTMIYEATVVGNTTMSELFTGVDPTYLAPAPFIPAYVHGIEMSGRELGFELNPEAIVHLLPNIAGYVGADTMGVILGTHIHERPPYCMAIDVGTNGEIVLAGNGRILACSTAAGPAFEGAQIKFGMRAAEGAIEEVYIDNESGTCHVKVIGDKKPRGICGSGLLDAVAQLYDEGILNFKGAFNTSGEAYDQIHPALKERLISTDSGYEFILTTAEESAKHIPVTLCQKDVRELQMAKGAIFAGMRVLMNEMKITIDDVQELLVAGAFGNYIKPDSALSIGLFPVLPKGKIISIGNAASEGGRLALVSSEERELCGELARKAEYIELSSRLDFQDEYVMALYFPTK